MTRLQSSRGVSGPKTPASAKTLNHRRTTNSNDTLDSRRHLSSALISRRSTSFFHSSKGVSPMTRLQPSRGVSGPKTPASTKTPNHRLTTKSNDTSIRRHLSSAFGVNPSPWRRPRSPRRTPNRQATTAQSPVPHAASTQQVVGFSHAWACRRKKPLSVGVTSLVDDGTFPKPSFVATTTTTTPFSANGGKSLNPSMSRWTQGYKYFKPV